MDSAVARPSWPRGMRDARDPGYESPRYRNLFFACQPFDKALLMVR